MMASYLIGLAAVLDFMDGMVARLLKAYSEIGKQLDSLADMVTFGLLPGMMLYKLIEFSATGNSFLPWFAFLVPVFSAIRLAKFNIDVRQTDSFIGVPTPANAMLIASLPLISTFEPQLNAAVFGTLITNCFFLIGLTLVMSLLMVAELPLFSLKFKNLQWSKNRIRFIFLSCSLILLILFHFVAIPVIIFLYIILSIIHNFSTSNSVKNNP